MLIKEQSANCANDMGSMQYILTAAQETSMMWLHAGSYNYNIGYISFHILRKSPQS